MQEMQVRTLGREDPLGEGSGNPLQYSCLGKPLDRRAWWVTVHEGLQKVSDTNYLATKQHHLTHAPSSPAPVFFNIKTAS